MYSASITVLPVMCMSSRGMPSRKRFSASPVVGAKNIFAILSVSTLLASSGNGRVILLLRNPASTCPIATCR